MLPNISCYLKKIEATKSSLGNLPLIPVLKKTEQENPEFRASMGYKVKSLNKTLAIQALEVMKTMKLYTFNI